MRHTPADEPKVRVSRTLIARLIEDSTPVILAAQTVAEAHYVMVRKGRMSRDDARRRLEGTAASCKIVATDTAILTDGLVLSARHNLQTFDAIILTAAASAGCEILYSEDMAAGFVWRGVTVVNPFA